MIRTHRSSPKIKCTSDRACSFGTPRCGKLVCAYDQDGLIALRYLDHQAAVIALSPLLNLGMCPEVRGKRTAPSTPSSGYQIRRQPPCVREPRSDAGSRRCVVVESGQKR